MPYRAPIRERGELVEQGSGLAIEPGDHDSIKVVRGVKRAYCFTIDGPFDVDAEDIPEEITAVMLNPTHLYTVSAEGSSQPSIPQAIRFSRKAVALLEGAVRTVCGRAEHRGRPRNQLGRNGSTRSICAGTCSAKNLIRIPLRSTSPCADVSCQKLYLVVSADMSRFKESSLSMATRDSSRLRNWKR